MNHASLESIVEKQKKRYGVLRKLYEIAGDDPTLTVFDSVLVREEKLTFEELHRIQFYLFGEGLINRGSGGATLTHDGIKEVEDSIQNPKQSTEHFMSVVIQHFYGNVEGGVQTGGVNNTQDVSIKTKE